MPAACASPPPTAPALTTDAMISQIKDKKKAKAGAGAEDMDY